ncbi:MAG: right-handed parallel beta-helix repeat-containing protein [Kiritimatiellae bacterium]|nr:right-handed parallel beta-helix repeat-containing protein [Kiritimatiellia bacterium]
MTWFFGLMAAVACRADTFVSPTGGNVHPFGSWETAARDIQTAVDAAQAGSTVWIEGGHRYLVPATISLTKGIVVRGYGEAKPVIDGGGAVRPFTVNHANAWLQALVVSNGFHSANAGGVYLAAGTVEGCDVLFNTAPASAGMMINGNATATNCYIAFNVASSGLFGGVGLLHGGARLRDCIVEGNRTQGERGAGGGVINGPAIVDGCTFSNNVTENAKSAGGFAVLADGAFVSNCRFLENQGREGGGAYMTANGVVSNCVFIGNIATLEGGAMRLDKGVVVNCEMRRNSAGGSGGAVMNRTANQAVMRNCLVAGNTAASSAGGVVAISANGLIMENCTVADNNLYGVYDWVDNAIAKVNCIVYFNTNNWNRATQWQTSCTSPAVPGDGNQDAAPGFEDRGKGDYALSSKSECIDAGTTLAWMVGARDLAGSPRLASRLYGATQDPQVDLGAYEYVPGPPKASLLSIR